MIREYPHERVFIAVLMLRVWIMYGKSKKIGLFLGAVYAISVVLSLIIPSKQPTVGQITQNTAYAHSDTSPDSQRSDTSMYVQSTSWLHSSLMTNSSEIIDLLSAIVPK